MHNTHQIWYRRIFLVFVSVFLARIFSIALLLNPTLVLNSPEWLVRFLVNIISILEFCFYAAYIVYGVASILVAKALSKNVIPIAIYFFSLPAILFYIAMRGGIVWGILGNALLGTTLTVYWLLSRELEEDAGEFSFFHRD